MDPNDMCESFLVADKFFTGENFDLKKINEHYGFYEFCPRNKPCQNNMQGIVALSTYLFLKLKAHQNNEHGEYFLMWLSDKLFTIHSKGKKQGKSNKITLNEAYYKYLKKHVHNYEYWNLLGNIKGLKEANLRHMNEFYKLLNHICKTIIYYKIKNAEPMSPLQNSTNSFNQYMLLYQNVSKCNSYLHLLDNLKKKYNKFRTIIRSIDPKLASSLQTLTTIKNNDSYFAENFNKFDFSDSKCKLRYDDKILDKFTQAKDQGKQTDNGTNGDNNLQNAKLQSSVDQPPSKELVSGNQGAAPNIKSNEPAGKIDTLTDTKSELGKSKDKSGIQESEKNGSDDIHVSQMENSNGEIDTPESSDSGSTSEPTDPQDDKRNQGGSGNESQNLMTQKNDQSITEENSGDIKLQNILNSVKNTFEIYSFSLYETYTDVSNRLHESMSSALENAHTNSRYIANKVIEKVSEQLQKHPKPEKKNNSPSDHKESEPKTPSSSTDQKPQNPLASNSQSVDPPTSPLTTNSPAADTSLKVQKGTPINFNRLTKNSATDTGIKERTQKVIFLRNIFKGEVPNYVKGIVILVPIILGIMYKYLTSGWRKKLKQKKKMKKVINSIGGKRPVQIIIKSVDTKKMANPVIKPVRGEKISLLNIYKLMQADPAPFINLFFLLIFFVYKRKYDFIEL